MCDYEEIELQNEELAQLRFEEMTEELPEKDFYELFDEADWDCH